MSDEQEALEQLQSAYRNVFVAKAGTASETDQFNVLADLCDRYKYFFTDDDGKTDEELREANAKRRVVAWILSRALQPGDDLLSRLHMAVVARRSS